MDAGTHSLLVVDEDERICASMTGLRGDDVVRAVHHLRAWHCVNTRVFVDGADFTAEGIGVMVTRPDRTDAGTHAVLVLGDGRVLEEKTGVPAAEVGRLVLELRTRHGQGARVLVDGVDFDQQAIAKIAAEVAPQVVPPRAPPRAVGDVNPLAVVEVSFTMLWDTYDRAAKVQGWLLNQASTFTAELLENNRRLAEQASELQKRYQASIAEIDFMAREKMMMDAEASASRYGRFLIDKAREEAASARPARSGQWLDEMIDGIAFAVGMMGGVQPPREPWDPN